MAAPNLVGVWKYNPDQPRDEAGRWSADGGSTFGDSTAPVRSWEGFPFRTATGEQPASFDLPPRRTPEGDFILYHGTSAQAAESILRSQTFLPDDIGRVGFGTDPIKVSTFATMKAPRDPDSRAFIEAVLDQHWLGQHTWVTREGNHESLFLLGPKAGGKLTIPPEAIKGMRLISRDEAWDLRKDWDPEQHPRDEKGRFISVNGENGPLGGPWQRSLRAGPGGELTEGATARAGDFVPRSAEPAEFAPTPGIHEMGTTPSEAINYGRIVGTRVEDRVVQPDLFPGVRRLSTDEVDQARLMRLPLGFDQYEHHTDERGWWTERQENGRSVRVWWNPMPSEAPSWAEGPGHWTEAGPSWEWVADSPSSPEHSEGHSTRGRDYLEAQSMAPEDLFAAAKAAFPNEGPIRDTGWILPDGTRLDFGRARGFNAPHWVAHGEVGNIMPGVGPSIEAIDIFRQAGAIRVDTGHPGDKAAAAMVIDLDKEPTQAQWDTLEAFRAIPGIKYAYAGRGDMNEEHRISIDSPNWKEEVRRAIGYGDNPDVLLRSPEAPENPLAQRVSVPSAERMAAEAAHEAQQAADAGLTVSAFRELEAVQNQAAREGWSEEREDAALEAIRQRGRGVVKAEWRKGYPEYNPDQPRDESGRWGEGGMTARSGEFVPRERPAPSIAVGPTSAYTHPPQGYTSRGAVILDPDVRTGGVQLDLLDSGAGIAEFDIQRLVQPDLFPEPEFGGVARMPPPIPSERPEGAVGPGHWDLMGPNRLQWSWVEEAGAPSWATGPGHWESVWHGEGEATREWVSDPTPEPSEEESYRRDSGEPGPMTEVPPDEALRSAVDIFGTTDNPHQAAFVLPSGDMLDFSGVGKFSHVTPWGDRPDLDADGRYVIHQQIGQVYGQDWHDIYRAGGHDDSAVDKFIEETKAIRFTNGWQGYTGTVGVVAAHALTQEQMDRIQQALDAGSDTLVYSGPGTERHLYDEQWDPGGNWRAEIAHEDADLEPNVIGQDEGDFQQQRTEAPHAEELAAEAARATEAGMTVSEYRRAGELPASWSDEERDAARANAAILRSQGVVKAEWDESQHPRDERGQWTDAGGAAVMFGDTTATSAPAADSPAEIAKLTGALKRLYGTTEDPTTAGFVLPSGEMVSYYHGHGEFRNEHELMAMEALDKAGLGAVPYGLGSSNLARLTDDGIVRMIFDPSESHLYFEFGPKLTPGQTRTLRSIIAVDRGMMVSVDHRDPVTGGIAGRAFAGHEPFQRQVDELMRERQRFAAGARGGHWAEMRTVKEWDESAHPRVPPGSPEGGQWTNGEGGSGAGEVRTGPLMRLAMHVADMTIEERWGWFGAQNRMALANPTVTIPHAIAGVRAELPSDNPRERVRLAVERGLIMPDAERPMLDRLDALDRDLARAGAPASAAGRLRDLIADAYLAQEHEALGRSLGDHGVRHLSQDVEDARAILDAIPGHLGSDPRVGAMLEIAGAFHDTGYLTPPGQLFMDQGHPDWAAAYYREAVAPLAVEALGANASARIEEMIATHESTAIDWRRGEALASAFRVADNLALFHQEKLPALVRYIPSTRFVLEGLANGSLKVSEARALLADHISQRAGLPPEVREKLYAAASETSILLPKFTLGMYGGRTTGFEWTGDHLRVNLLRLPPDALTRVGNLHVNQFYKLAKSFGLDEEAVRLKSNVLHFRRGSRELLEINIKGEPIWKRLLRGDWVEKYSPDQPRDEQGRWTDGTGGGTPGGFTVIPQGQFSSFTFAADWPLALSDAKIGEPLSATEAHVVADARASNPRTPLSVEEWSAVHEKLAEELRQLEIVRDKGPTGAEYEQNQVALAAASARLAMFRAGATSEEAARFVQGMAERQGSWTTGLRVGAGYYRGVHDWEGRIKLTPQSEDELRRWLAGERSRETWNGLETVMHELQHGQSPVAGHPEEYVNGYAIFLEEGLTELRARELTAAIYEAEGGTPQQAQVPRIDREGNLRFSNLTPVEYIGSLSGAYNSEVSALQRLGREEPGILAKLWAGENSTARWSLLDRTVRDRVEKTYRGLAERWPNGPADAPPGFRWELPHFGGTVVVRGYTSRFYDRLDRVRKAETVEQAWEAHGKLSAWSKNLNLDPGD